MRTAISCAPGGDPEEGSDDPDRGTAGKGVRREDGDRIRVILEEAVIQEYHRDSAPGG